MEDSNTTLIVRPPLPVIASRRPGDSIQTESCDIIWLAACANMEDSNTTPIMRPPLPVMASRQNGDSSHTGSREIIWLVARRIHPNLTQEELKNTFGKAAYVAMKWCASLGWISVTDSVMECLIDLLLWNDLRPGTNLPVKDQFNTGDLRYDGQCRKYADWIHLNPGAIFCPLNWESFFPGGGLVSPMEVVALHSSQMHYDSPSFQCRGITFSQKSVNCIEPDSTIAAGRSHPRRL